MRTNIGCKLKFGKEERVFRLEFISNQRISPQEFTKWKEACTEANISLPTIGKISYKVNSVQEAYTKFLAVHILKFEILKSHEKIR